MSHLLCIFSPAKCVTTSIAKATLGDFQLDRIGDALAALKFYDQAVALRRHWLAREPSNDEAKRGVANT